jgi:hypothetical protein
MGRIVNITMPLERCQIKRRKHALCYMGIYREVALPSKSYVMFEPAQGSATLFVFPHSRFFRTNWFQNSRDASLQLTLSTDRI